MLGLSNEMVQTDYIHTRIVPVHQDLRGGRKPRFLCLDVSSSTFSVPARSKMSFTVNHLFVCLEYLDAGPT